MCFPTHSLISPAPTTSSAAAATTTTIITNIVYDDLDNRYSAVFIATPPADGISIASISSPFLQLLPSVIRMVCVVIIVVVVLELDEI